MPDRTCSVDGCPKPCRPGANSTLCPMHYHRWYRHGSLDLTAAAPSAPRVRKPRRYRRVGAKGHPLVNKNGTQWEHRIVLYDSIGDGPHPCHWCNKPLTWGGLTATSLLVDHLNGITDDNRIENLVPSCGGCNAGRGMQERSDRLREAGWWSNHDTVDRLTQPRRPRIDA